MFVQGRNVEHSEPSCQRLRAAVIGTGKISEEHLRFLTASAARVAGGVCDLSPSLAKYAVAAVRRRGRLHRCGQMLREARPDVVHVLTPPHTHAPLVDRCDECRGSRDRREAGGARRIAEFGELLSLADRRVGGSIEDHNYRFNEPILAIERLGRRRGARRGARGGSADGAGDPQEGQPVHGRQLPHPSHKLPAACIHEFITHLCYLMLRFLPRYERVAAAWSKHGADRLFKYDDLDALLIGPSATREFASPATPPQTPSS